MFCDILLLLGDVGDMVGNCNLYDSHSRNAGPGTSEA
jgi:hypothetical protein